MSKLVSISVLDLESVTGGFEGQAGGDIAKGYVARGQFSFASGASSRQQALERACTYLQTDRKTKEVDQNAVGQCVLDHMYPPGK